MAHTSLAQFTSTSSRHRHCTSNPSITMAHYQEVDYCSEEVRSVASPAGFGRHDGVQPHVVREKFEEVDRFSRTGSHGHHHHGHHGHHGHGSGHFVVRETKVEEDINTCTGEFHERKESFVVRSD